jgi:asparagine synthase (glutamine-hydrolysing)
MANGHVLSHEPAKRRIWGGDGGSVGIGHVYLSPPAVRLMREQGPEAAAREFLRYNTIALAQKAFRADYGNYVATLPLRTMTDELKRLDCRDPARALFVFLLENDQRRHLTAQWELFDLYSHEFVEPFYDPEVLTAACQLPLDFCLRHHMYHEWLRTFSEPAYTIPWQSYPGHESCPVQVPDGLMSQFGGAPPALTAARREQANQDARSAIRSLGMLRSYLNAPVLLAAYLAFQLRLSEPLYIFKQVGLLSKVVNRCEGRVNAPS